MTEHSTPVQAARCRGRHHREKSHTFECSFTSCLKANKPVALFQRALKQVRTNGVLSGAGNCSAFPKSAGLVGALGPPASSGALLSPNITRLERTPRGLLYRLHFSELLNVNSCKLQGWSSQGSTSPLRLFSSEEPLASWRLCQRQKWECEDM